MRKLIFDRLGFGHSDRSLVVNMNSGAEKGTNGITSSQVYADMQQYSAGISLMCVLMCV